MVGRWPWFEAPNVQPLANVAGRRQSNVAPLHPERTLPPNRHTKVGQAPFPRGTARSCFGDAAPLFANLALGTGLDAPATHTVKLLCGAERREARRIRITKMVEMMAFFTNLALAGALRPLSLTTTSELSAARREVGLEQRAHHP